MSRFPRFRRRPDHWASAHERARRRAAERLDGPLGLTESTWLDEHLAGCAACASIAIAYEADRLALRALRETSPEPPRDLWARTAAAIEAESAARGSAPAPTTGRGWRVPVGALSGIAVIAVVVGVSATSNGLLGGGGASVAIAPTATAMNDTAGGASSESAPTSVAEVPHATPLAVGAGEVEWLRRDPDGGLAYNSAQVYQVCPIDGAADCAALDDLDGQPLDQIPSPRSIIASPVDGRAVVVSDAGDAGEQVLVLALPDAGDGVDTLATPEPPAATPEPAVDPTPAPSDEPVPTPSSEATTPPPSPTVSPEPTVAASLAIASDISVVGESAAFSSDGGWFAFTARPRDGSAGPDVYVWRVGDPSAERLTSGGRTYFAGWDGGTVVVSRTPEGANGATTSAATLAIDPSTGDERELGAVWRPIVDPAGARAVAWIGTVGAHDDGATHEPRGGSLALVAWPLENAPVKTGVIATDIGADYDVRWDETGTWFAVWIADPSGSEVGRLSLYRVDPETGALEIADGAPVDVAALPGFSIGHGRLAWATPPGQGGEGSRVQVVAWVADGVGTVETAPGEDVLVVR